MTIILHGVGEYRAHLHQHYAINIDILYMHRLGHFIIVMENAECHYDTHVRHGDYKVRNHYKLIVVNTHTMLPYPGD